MPAVDAEAGAITRPQECPFSEVRKGFTAFADGDVIMAKITPCMENGKAAIGRGLTNGLGFGSTEFHVLRPMETVAAEWVYYFIRQESFRKQAESEMTGSVGQKRVPVDFLSESEIPLPPLPEQRRIVEKVEALLARVNAARARLARAPALLKAFRQAILSAACSAKLTEEWRHANGVAEEWPTRPLQEVIEDLGQGWSPKCDITPVSAEDEWGVIKTTAVQAMAFLEDENKGLPKALSPRKDLELKAGDLLITRAGPRARAGVSCFVRAVRPRLIVCDKVYRFRVDRALAHAEFIELVLNAPAMVQTIDTIKTGTSESGMNLTQAKFLALEFILPSLSEQHEIVRRVGTLFGLADTIEARVAAAQKRADALTQAILAKAFRGELVPTEAALAHAQGRAYESAGGMLSRLMEKREVKAVGGRREKRG